MKKIQKFFCVLVISMMICDFDTTTAYSAGFVERTSAPSFTDSYYCAPLNNFSNNGGKGNCTWYAYGRAYEILGKKPVFSGNAENWWNYRDSYYGYGSIDHPKVGAIAVWGGTYGHVAVVEKVYADGSVDLSESSWSGVWYSKSYWGRKTYSKAALNSLTSSMGTLYFQGYIYLLNDDTELPVVSNSSVSNINSNGYTVTCNISDNIGVTSVKFPTWTENAGQDDLIWYDGSINGNVATITIQTGSHHNETGLYNTHIYAYDAAGNYTSVPITAVVPAAAGTDPGTAEYDYSDWSGWQTEPITANDTTEVETRTTDVYGTRTQYSYEYWRYYNTSLAKYMYKGNGNRGGEHYSVTLDYMLTPYSSTSDGQSYYRGGGEYFNFKGELWYNQAEVSTQIVTGQRTEYRYRTKTARAAAITSTPAPEAISDSMIGTQVPDAYDNMSGPDDSGVNGAVPVSTMASPDDLQSMIDNDLQYSSRSSFSYGGETSETYKIVVEEEGWIFISMHSDMGGSFYGTFNTRLYTNSSLTSQLGSIEMSGANKVLAVYAEAGDYYYQIYYAGMYQPTCTCYVGFMPSTARIKADSIVYSKDKSKATVTLDYDEDYLPSGSYGAIRYVKGSISYKDIATSSVWYQKDNKNIINGNTLAVTENGTYSAIIISNKDAYYCKISFEVTDIVSGKPAAPKIGSYKKNSRTVSGTGAYGNKVYVKVNGKYYDTTVGKDGKWSVSVPKLKAGMKLTAYSKSAAGVKSKTTTVTVK